MALLCWLIQWCNEFRQLSEAILWTWWWDSHRWGLVTYWHICCTSERHVPAYEKCKLFCEKNKLGTMDHSMYIRYTEHRMMYLCFNVVGHILCTPIYDIHEPPLEVQKIFKCCCLSFVPFPCANVPLASKGARIKTSISENNKSKKRKCYRSSHCSHNSIIQTDQLHFNKQLNLIYKQNPWAKFKYMSRQLRNAATLNQMVRRKQIKYTNTTIPATIIYPQQPVDAFTWSSQVEKKQ